MKEKTLTALTLLAQAYGFALAGKATMAGKLLVKASEDGALDGVMQGLGDAAAELDPELAAPEEGATDNGDEDLPLDEAPEEVLAASARARARSRAAARMTGCGDVPSPEEGEDEPMEDDLDDDEVEVAPTPAPAPSAEQATVEMPASVARLAARTLV